MNGREVVDELVRGHGATLVEQRPREQGALLRPAGRDEPAAHHHLQRAEDSDLERHGLGGRECRGAVRARRVIRKHARHRRSVSRPGRRFHSGADADPVSSRSYSTFTRVQSPANRARQLWSGKAGTRSAADEGGTR
jgi:hypothetical protein